MKTKILALAITVVLGLSCGTAWAYSVRIDDSAPGAPIVTTDLVGNYSGTGSATVVTGNEEATITGYLPTPTVLTPLGTSRSVIFVEPSGPPLPSDFVVLTIGDYQGGPGNYIQFVRIFFQSDGATGFNSNVANLPNLQGTVIENGSYQDIIFVLDSSPLHVLVQSGEEAPTGVSEPYSMLLLGFGLTGLAAFRGKLRND